MLRLDRERREEACRPCVEKDAPDHREEGRGNHPQEGMPADEGGFPDEENDQGHERDQRRPPGDSLDRVGKLVKGHSCRVAHVGLVALHAGIVSRRMGNLLKDQDQSDRR